MANLLCTLLLVCCCGLTSGEYVKWDQVLKKAPWPARAIPHGGLFNGSFYVVSRRATMPDTLRAFSGSDPCASSAAGTPLPPLSPRTVTPLYSQSRCPYCTTWFADNAHLTHT